MKKNKKRSCLKKLIASLMVFLAVLIYHPTVVYANSAIGITDEFDDLGGDAEYLGSNYRDNYRLDTEHLGITEAGYTIVDMISNAIFSIHTFLGYIFCAIYYFAMNFDITELLAPVINSIQEALRSNVFLPLFKLAYVGAVAIMILRLIRRDFMGIMGQLGKVVFILVLSVLIVNDSATVLSYTTKITKGISVDILTGVSGVDIGSGNVESYAAGAAGVLWVSLVHQPWISLEFGSYSYSNEDVEFFLSDADQDAREEKIAEIQQGDKNAFSKRNVPVRAGRAIIILVMMIFKGIIYTLVAIMQIVFQVVAIFFVLAAPVILLLALLPGYDFDLLSIWVKKIFESQVGIVLLTFTMGIMILIDQLLQQLAGQVGWMIVLLLQIAISAGIYFKRNMLFGMLSNTQKNMRFPNRMKMQLRNSGNAYEYVASATNQARHAAASTRDTASRVADRAADGIGRFFPRVSDQSNDSSKGHDVDTPRPSTSQNNRPEIPVAQPSGSQVPGTESNYDTGIIGLTYYAPPEVTDNVHDLWNNAKRPTTEQKNVPHRAVVKSRPTTTDQRPSMDQKEEVQSNNGSIQQTNQEKVMAAMAVSSGRVARPTTSGAEGLEVSVTGSQESARPTSSMKPGVQPTGSGAVPRPVTDPAVGVEPPSSGSGTVPRPVTGQAAEVESYPAGSGAVARPVTSQAADAESRPAGSGAVARPVTGQVAETESRPAGSGAVARPVTGQAVETESRPAGSGAVARPVTGQAAETESRPAGSGAVARPATGQATETESRSAGSGVVARPATGQVVETESRPAGSKAVARPATGQAAETESRPARSGVVARPATGQAAETELRPTGSKAVARPATGQAAEAKSRPIGSGAVAQSVGSQTADAGSPPAGSRAVSRSKTGEETKHGTHSAVASEPSAGKKIVDRPTIRRTVVEPPSKTSRQKKKSEN